jgi:phosphate:Na+ symporter
MCDIAKDCAYRAFALIGKYDEKAAALLTEGEQQLDLYEDKLGTYLVKLSARELTNADSWEISRLLHAIGDFERMGDHAVNLLQSAQELFDKGIVFSPAAQADLHVLRAALEEVIDTTARAFKEHDAELAKHVEPLEQVIDELVFSMRSRHIARLQAGECAIEPGFVWSDLMINCERMSDHCSNIAVCLIQMSSRSMEGHTYLSEARSADNPEFMPAFEAYRAKYSLK